jgi:5-methylcytosine-specific restriction endonuclease McrA
MERVAEWRRRTKARLVAEAGGACAICGYSHYVGALEFHHVDPEQKSFALSARGLTRSIEGLRAELAKCVLLCSNCHAEVEGGVTALPSSPQVRSGVADR